MIRAFFFAHYTAWAFIWAYCLYYYGQYAHQEWRQAGGAWRHVPRDVFNFLRFVFAPLAGDVNALLHGRPLPAADLDYRYNKAHRIAFSISLGSLSYVVMGIVFSLWPDRSTWSLTYQLFSTILVGLTAAAGIGHLFSALEHSPRRWRWFIFGVLCWYPLSMALFERIA